VNATRFAIHLSEHGRLPDVVVRAGIRRLLARRLDELTAGGAEDQAARIEAFVREMATAPIAPLPALANAQHYELPPAFFAAVLGPRRKYSACLWAPGVTTLAEAEDAALAATCARADIADGQRILELGCGWGSLTLWMAERLPRARITAVSNSASQRAFIEAELARRGLANVRVVTADMNDFALHDPYDRIVSVEMLEHMRNWPRLFARIHDWLVPGGRFFMHVFCHRAMPYAFEPRNDDDWMSRHFFSGGMMPSDELPLRVAPPLRFLARWRWDGTHYRRTADAWLDNMDRATDAVRPVLAATYGAPDMAMWQMRWRIFLMSCAELFGYRDGQEWWVSHYLLERAR
jgi:cyclopropane-fatty-acyl-phospholipid synthase